MRRRLLAITVATTTLVVVAFAIPLGGLVRAVARDRAITAAERDTAALAPVLALTADPASVVSAIERTSTGADGRLSVWLPDDTQLGDQTPADADALQLAGQQQISFSREGDDGLDLYAPIVTGEEDVSVTRARIPNSLLEQGVVRAWLALGGVAVVLVIAAAVVADRLARSLTRDATALSVTARTLAGGDPEARVEPGSTPELVDAGRALNLLADRIDELRAAERERVADLSHRLRTPLTALRLDAEAADDPDLLSDVDKLEAAVTELVQAARRPHPRPAASAEPMCDLTAVVRERAEFWAALADDDDRQWRLAIEPAAVSATVGLGADDAAAAVDALLDNVFAHTPDGTGYAISLAVEDEVVRLSVEDTGAGIDDARTVLPRGQTSARSTGLGLDIARRAAEAAGGRLTISRSQLGGARVTLELPRPGYRLEF